jgi:uncharacterized protein YndB with AHSA1/START domain
MPLVTFQKEYLINASDKIVFQCLTTPSGLSGWFADDVNIRGNVFTFIWDGSEERAELISKKKDDYVRFKWLDVPEEKILEMRIRIDELTGELALLISDMAEEDELEEAGMLWNKQIDNLKHLLGS